MRKFAKIVKVCFFNGSIMAQTFSNVYFWSTVCEKIFFSQSKVSIFDFIFIIFHSRRNHLFWPKRMYDQNTIRWDSALFIWLQLINIRSQLDIRSICQFTMQNRRRRAFKKSKRPKSFAFITRHFFLVWAVKRNCDNYSKYNEYCSPVRWFNMKSLLDDIDFWPGSTHQWMNAGGYYTLILSAWSIKWSATV